ncbi:MAG: hypothetical protein AMXMBFR84_13480 [Candidatus Hydrogenedentota bacterium]
MLDRSEPKKFTQARPAVPEAKPPADPVVEEGDTYEALAEAGRRGEGGLFSRMGAAFQDAIQSSRGTGRTRSPAEEGGNDPEVTADDLAIRRARTIKLQRMVVPEGVIIQGNLMSGSETEIAGKIEGDVTVDGRLYLGASALVTGNVRAGSCKIEGLVEGKVECSQELELGRTARLNAEAMAGKQVVIGGKIFGDVTTGGTLRLVAGASLQGNIRARRIVIEEGALFNGTCAMRPPAQRTEQKAAQQQQQQQQQ